MLPCSRLEINESKEARTVFSAIILLHSLENLLALCNGRGSRGTGFLGNVLRLRYICECRVKDRDEFKPVAVSVLR